MQSIRRSRAWGTMLGLIAAFGFLLLFTGATPTNADDWCPDTTSCTGAYCFTRGDGVKSCKYLESSCNGGACQKVPGDEDPPIQD